MGMEERIIFHVTLTAKVGVETKDSDEALKMAREVIKQDQGDLSWTIEKEVQYVFRP